MKRMVLDASAVMTFFENRPGADKVEDLIHLGLADKRQLLMSVVNWGEVYYTIARARGLPEAARIMERVKLLPLAVLDADEAVTARAAKLKAGYGLPYADCFAAATAETNGVLVTSDAKDFRKVPGLHLLPLPEHRP